MFRCSSIAAAGEFLENSVWCEAARQDTLAYTHAPRILPTLSGLYQIRQTRRPSPHCNANEKECADKRPDPKDERAGGGQGQQMLKGESLSGRWEAAEESVLVVAGDHSLAPPQQRLIQGFCRSFSGALLGGVIPVGLQRASLFIWGWPSRQVAGALWSCQGEGTSFPGEGTPSSSYLHRGFLLGGQSGTGQDGDNYDMGFNSTWPRGFLERGGRQGRRRAITLLGNIAIILTPSYLHAKRKKKPHSDRSQNTFSAYN